MKPLHLASIILSFAALAGSAFGQTPDTTVTRGFDLEIPADATGEERQAQSNLWVLSLRFKSVRMMELEVTDPQTGKPRTDLVYYLVYEAINREIDRNAEDPQTTPANEFDEPPGPELFVPEIMLVVEDEVTGLTPGNSYRREIRDEVIPEAQRRIQIREKMKLLNSVQAVGSVPAIVPKDEKNPTAFYGVSLFRNVDPRMDYFRLVLSGFSNGYKLVKGPVSYDDLKNLAKSSDLKVNDQVWNGDLDTNWRAAAEVGDLFDIKKTPPVNADAFQWYYSVSPDRGDATARVWRKSLIVHYWRPGDDVDQNEREIRRKGEPRWVYIPDDARTTAGNSAAVETAKTEGAKSGGPEAARLATLPRKQQAEE